MRALTPALAAVALAALASTSAARADITDAPTAPKTAVKVTTVATGLENPWALQFLPDGRMLVTERPGRMRIVGKDGAVSDEISGVPDVYARGQGGLLDVRLATDFATSGTLFFSYSEPRGRGESATALARAKLTLDGDGGGALSEVTTIWQQNPPVSSSSHFGSRIVIAPDGTLFVTTGDRGSKREWAQEPDKLLGKVIHITTDGAPVATDPAQSGWPAEVWSQGHRNIQGAAIRPETGKLWTVEHGAMGGDELNRPERGKNYGWPVISYGRNYTGTRIGEGTAKDGFEQPVYYWEPSIATGTLMFYDGDLFPEWRGNAFVGGLAGSQISRLVLDGDTVVSEETLVTEEGHRFRDLRQGPDGALYAVVEARNGGVLRIAPGE